MTSFGGRSLYTGELTSSSTRSPSGCRGGAGTKLMILPPLMHGAAQWAVMTAMTTGQSVVFSSVTDHFDADDVVRTIEREKVMAVTVVGDAMARPLADAIERGDGRPVVAGGGGQRRRAADPDRQTTADRRQARPDRRRRRRLLGDRRPDEPHVRAGRGVDRKVQRGPGHQRRRRGSRRDPRAGPRRHGLAGAARLRAAGLQGRRGQDGGDVPGHRRRALLGAGRPRAPSRRRRHRAARPRLGDHQLRRREDLRRGGRDGDRVASRRWPTWWWRAGPASGGGRRSSRSSRSPTAPRPTPQELIDHAAGVIARYKLPKAVVFRPVIERSPAGKADYRWAREQALSEGA